MLEMWCVDVGHDRDRSNSRAPSQAGSHVVEEVDSDFSYLPSLPLPQDVEPARILQCQDYSQDGRDHASCGLEFRQPRFVFETETW